MVVPLAQHVSMVHPEVQILTVTGELFGLLVLSNFDFDDPAIVVSRVAAAANVHQFVRRSLTDEDIEVLVDHFPFSEWGMRHDMGALLRQQRDYLNYSDILQPVQAVKTT